MPRSEQCVPLCRLSPTLFIYQNEVESIPLGKGVLFQHRGPTDELLQLYQSTETGLVLTTGLKHLKRSDLITIVSQFFSLICCCERYLNIAESESMELLRMNTDELRPMELEFQYKWV